MSPSPASSARNVRLYPLYAGLFNAFFWMPVFFLFFNEHLALDEVLRLEAIYYAAVVLLEVPSGYFSDTVGRRPTLLISALALSAASALFLAGSSFAVFAAAQVLLAAGIAFNSGTDVSFHYDALAALGRGAEFDAREARVARIGFMSIAASAVLGGIAATFALRAAYALSLAAGIASLGVVLLFREPPRHERATLHGPGFLRQVRACTAYLRVPLLRWLFALSVLMVVLNHVPYELYQPYTRLLELDGPLASRGTPLVTGLHAAAVGLIAAVIAGRSIRIRDRIGLTGAMLAAVALQTLIIAAMGLVLHATILLLVLLRSVPRALMTAPMNAAVAPRVHAAHRATYLSIQSLAGRLSFAGFLVLLSLAAGAPDAAEWATLSRLLLISAGVGVGVLIVLGVTAPRPARAER